jgi:hypothetical protein
MAAPIPHRLFGVLDVFQKGPSSAVLGGFRHHPLFDSDDYFPKSHPERERGAYFFLGRRGSGAGFHSHDHAYNALLFGRKRWFLLPPVSGFGALGHTLSSLTSAMEAERQGVGNELESMKPRMLQCMQHAGEVLFVPSMWSHAVVNDELAAGVAVQVGWSWAQ